MTDFWVNEVFTTVVLDQGNDNNQSAIILQISTGCNISQPQKTDIILLSIVYPKVTDHPLNLVDW